MTLSAPSRVRKDARFEPKKPDGFCCRLTMSFEPGARAKPAGGEHRLIALGQKLVPDLLAHRRPPPRSSSPRGWPILEAEAGGSPWSRTCNVNVIRDLGEILIVAILIT